MKNLIKNIKAKASKLNKKATAVMAAFAATLMSIVPAYATQDVTIGDLTNLSVNQLLGKIVGIILTLAQAIGLILLVSGIFQLVMAYKDDNADAKTRGIQLAIVGVVLITFKAILQGVGIIG